MMSGDSELLRQYVRERSEDAFADLVRRHLPLVYSAALRQVRSAQAAEEVSQSVFCELARSAHKLKPDTVLAAWLYSVTGRKAIDFIRRESRRRTRERVAGEWLEMNANRDPWTEIEPLLDTAMRELDDADRTIILLRYFENKPLRELGAVLGISEDAAQKRTARAIERLRAFFSKRAVTVNATILSTALSTHAVTAAPAALVSSLAKAAGAGFAGTVTGAAAKGLTMTAFHKTMAGAAILIVAGTGVFQMHQTGTLRKQLQETEGKMSETTAALEQVARDRDTAMARATALRQENERLVLENVRARAATARTTATTRTEAAAESVTSSSEPDESVSGAASEPDGAELGRQLGQAVVRGEPGALERLRAFSRSTMTSFSTNRAGLNDQERQELHRRTFAPMREAFAVIEAAALEGNETALRAIADAVQLPELKDRAVSSLGKLAARGDANALEALLHGEAFGFHESSVVSALRLAAESGNQRAIDALASVARDPSAAALWYMAAAGLGNAAESGNAVAIDALSHLASSATNKNVYNAVLSGLQRAAYRGDARAAEALRKMGFQ